MENKIAIFASGTGSNAVRIIEHFAGKSIGEVSLIVSNKKNAGILKNPKAGNIPSVLIDRTSFYQTTDILKKLEHHQINFIALAGFLWKVPQYLISAYPGRIVNIHPALLPAYGGKGMYGKYVHEAVFNSRDLQSGMTVHFVNENYDEGAIIFQSTCTVGDADSPEEIARRVLLLEHQYYPQVIEEVLNQD